MGLLDRAAAKSAPSSTAAEPKPRGLLQRAEALSPTGKAAPGAMAPDIDAMGEALIERVLRLPISPSTPNAALSLLKAYAAYRSILCLHRESDSYQSYASFGFCSEMVNLSIGTVDRLTSAYAEYAPVPSAELEDGCYEAQSVLRYIFLDADHRDILIIENETPDPPEFQRIILDRCRSRLAYMADQKKRPPSHASDASPSDGTTDESIRDAYSSYAAEGDRFRCMVLDSRSDPSFHDRLRAAVSGFAVAHGLDKRRAFIFFPLGVDAELVSHRLKKSLGAAVLESFIVQDATSLTEKLDSFRRV